MPDQHLPLTTRRLIVRDLGRMAYADAFALQKTLQEETIAARRTDGTMHLLLVEHDPPVITVSRRKTARKHLTATPEQLRDAGIEVAETDRGGDITYHGPGQLVVYPILDLNALGLRLHGYLRFLEQVVIESLAAFDLTGERDEQATGVWIRPAAAGAGSAKICAMGVRVSRWVTMHGLALNVAPNLGHFDLIVPCGLVGRGVTSMERELGGKAPSLDRVRTVLTDRMRAAVAERLTRSA